MTTADDSGQETSENAAVAPVAEEAVDASSSDSAPDAAPATSTASPASPAGSSVKTLENARVLIVEDSVPIRMLVKKTLSIRGSHVDEGGEGREGLRLLRTAHEKGTPYDLMVLDLMMPGMSGLEMLQHLRADADLRGLRVVVVTARNSREEILKCSKFGVISYLLKPFTTQSLVEALEKALSKPDYNAMLEERRKKGTALTLGQTEELRELIAKAVEVCVDAYMNKKTVDEELVNEIKKVGLFLEKSTHSSA